MDPCIEGVHEEDRPIVRNVISALNILKKGPTIFTSWTCVVTKGFYIVTAYLGDGDWELGTRELDTVYDVNPLRIISVSVQNQGSKTCVRIRISDRNEPIMMTETQLVHLRKRSRWLHQ